MSDLTNAAETAIVALLLNGTTWLTLAQDHAAPATSLYLSLHTADPGEAGDQTTNEVAYTNYARVAIVRTASGWTVASGVGETAAVTTFPECGATPATATHFGIGTDASGAGNLLIHKELTSSRIISEGSSPEFAAGALTITAA